ncbi:Hypothetical predicted protein [Pelobates cultripes]|uniref:Uncharacterized protein n=1 Tax=Pelobates cultripes TaxID=61616 RepID=A0AAD1W5W5_PELCU|nr:Hypothetical predicted protein [Pelobates cultripes]
MPFQDGDAPRLRENSFSPPSSPAPLQEDGLITTVTTSAMIAEFAASLQSTITGQMQTMAINTRKEIKEIGQRTSHLEQKLADFATAHNGLANKLQTLEEVIEFQRLKRTGG